MFFGLPFDILGLIVASAILFSWLLYFGKSSGVSLFLALLISSFLQTISPLTKLLTTQLKQPHYEGPIALLLFLLMTVVLFFVFKRVVSTVFSWSPVNRIIEAILLTISILGLCILSIAPYIDTATITSFGKTISFFLALSNIYFYWLVGSFVILFFFSGRSS